MRFSTALRCVRAIFRCQAPRFEAISLSLVSQPRCDLDCLVVPLCGKHLLADDLAGLAQEADPVPAHEIVPQTFSGVRVDGAKAELRKYEWIACVVLFGRRSLKTGLRRGFRAKLIAA